VNLPLVLGALLRVDWAVRDGFVEEDRVLQSPRVA
jgi:hypothetical protein